MIRNPGQTGGGLSGGSVRSDSHPSGGTPAGPDPRIGTRLGKYEIVGVLGRGGMGVVYEAVDTRIDRHVAIKVLPDTLASDADALRRFLDEARAAGKVDHENVVGIYDVDQVGDVYYLAMQLVKGGSAQDHLKDRGPFNWPEATRIAADVCRGLAAAHDKGLIHRDIKPANIMRAGDGKVKLADFGLAKASDRDLGHTQTQAGAILGTPHYMSPEQCEGKPADLRSDIYSLGCTYYALLTGNPPYQSATVPQLMFSHCFRPMPDPRDLVPEIPAACVEALARAVAKAPEERFQSAWEMAAALDGIQNAVQQGDGLGGGAAEWGGVPDFGERSVTGRSANSSGARTPAGRSGGNAAAWATGGVTAVPGAAPRPRAGGRTGIPLTAVAMIGGGVALLVILAVLLFRGGGKGDGKTKRTKDDGSVAVKDDGETDPPPDGAVVDPPAGTGGPTTTPGTGTGPTTPPGTTGGTTTNPPDPKIVRPPPVDPVLPIGKADADVNRYAESLRVDLAKARTDADHRSVLLAAAAWMNRLEREGRLPDDVNPVTAAAMIAGGRAFLNPDQKVTMTGTAVTALCFGPAGKRVVIGTASGEVAVQNLGEERIWKSASVHPGGVTALAWLNNGRYVASGGADGSLRLWSFPFERPVSELPSLPGRIVSIHPFGRHSFVVCGSSGRVQIWEFDPAGRQGNATVNFETATELVDGAPSADGSRLLLVQADGQLRYMVIADRRGEQFHEPRHSAGGRGLLSPEGDRALSFGRDGRVLHFMFGQKASARVALEMTGTAFESAGLGVGGLLAFAGDAKGGLTVMEGRSGRLLARPRFLDDSPLQAIAHSTDGLHVALGRRNGEVTIYNLPAAPANPGGTAANPGGVPGTDPPVPAGHAAWIAPADGPLPQPPMLPVLAPPRPAELSRALAGVRSRLASPDTDEATRRRIILQQISLLSQYTSGGLGEVPAENIAATIRNGIGDAFRTPDRVLGEVKGAVRSLVFDRRGRHLAAILMNGRLVVVRLTDGKAVLDEAQPHVGSVLAVAFSDDGRYLAVVGSDGVIRVRSCAGWEVTGSPLMISGGAMNFLQFLPDGKLLAAGGNRNAVFVIRLEGTGDRLIPVIDSSLPLSSPVTDLQLSADRKGVLVALRDGQVREWVFGSPSRLLGHSVPDGTGRHHAVGNGDLSRVVSIRDSGRSNLLGPDIPGGRRSQGNEPSAISVAAVPGGRAYAVVNALGVLYMHEFSRDVRLGGFNPSPVRPDPSVTGLAAQVAFSPDGRLMAVGLRGAGVLLYHMPWPEVKTDGGPAVPGAPGTGTGPGAAGIFGADAPPGLEPGLSPAEARRRQMRWAVHLGLPYRFVNSLGTTFVLVPPGRFAFDGESDVVVSRPFYLSATELTQRDYAAVTGMNPSEYQTSPDLPVEKITFADAVGWCRRASELAGEAAAGRIYGIPSQAQWELACRAGAATRFHWGDDGDTDKMAAASRHGARTVRTAMFPPNALGLHDMHGNVAEYTSDGALTLLPGAAVPEGGGRRVAVNPVAGASQPGSPRGIRGGSWGFSADGCTADDRKVQVPATFADGGTGVRVMIEIAGPSPHVAALPAAEREWLRNTAAIADARVRAQTILARFREKNPLLAGTNERLQIDNNPDDVTGITGPGWAVSDLTPLRAAPEMIRIELPGSDNRSRSLDDLGALRGMAPAVVDLSRCLADDLTPLRGMPLRHLNIDFAQVKSLAPVAGMPLEVLGLTQSKVTDLTPLRSAPLRSLFLAESSVWDITPLRGKPLETLVLTGTTVRNLDLVLTMPALRVLMFEASPTRDHALVSALPPTVTTVNGRPRAAFLAELAKARAPFEQWVAATRRLAPEARMAAVIKRIADDNPGLSAPARFEAVPGAPGVDGAPSPVRFIGSGTELHDLSALAGMGTMLHGVKVSCDHGEAEPPVTLWPLAGLGIRSLTVSKRPVVDLTAMQREPLESLTLRDVGRPPLTPLTGLPLRVVEVDHDVPPAVLSSWSRLETLNGKPAR